LSYDGHPELLGIPFAAIKGFFDPSVQFGLQFDVDRGADAADDDTDIEDSDEAPPAPISPQDGEATGEKVVSLDAFRKKP
jgi:hypothetical protein